MTDFDFHSDSDVMGHILELLLDQMFTKRIHGEISLL